MVGLTALLIPILLSAVFVFVASSVIHMFTPWHNGDYPKLANEDRVLDALRPLALPPGDYMAPRPTGMAEMRTPAFAEKLKRGPVLILTVMPNGQGSMGKPLALWFVYSIVVGIFAGYVASHALPPGAGYLPVFRFVGTTAFLAYALGLWQMSIWYHRSWATTVRSTVDGLLYALLTAGTFGWLWPH